MSQSVYRTAASLAAFALASAWAVPALAQDAGTLPQDAVDDTAPSQDIVVTGSLIRGTPEDSALPVEVTSSQELAANGITNPLEFIKELPSSGAVLGDSNQFSTGSQGFQGNGSINLRGLGPQRTLVLFNNRRFIPSPGDGFSDTNLIPLFALDRIEILKDGAAATYGSDAIAGVANFITKKNFNGIQAQGDYKIIDGSKGDYNASIVAGHTFGAINILAGFGWQHRSELQSRKRDFTHIPYTINPAGFSTLGNPGSYLPRRGATPVAGVTLDGNQLGACAALTGFTSTTGPNGTGSPICRFSFVPFDNLVEKTDRYQAYGQADADLSDTVKWHAEALYASSVLPRLRYSPSFPPTQGPRGPGSVGAFTVPRSNPGFQTFINQSFVPGSATFNNVNTLADNALIILFRPFGLGGNPATDALGSQFGRAQDDAWRVSTGFDVEFSSTFRASAYGTYLRHSRTAFVTDAVGSRLQNALNGFGGPNCTGTVAGAGGCLYLNPFINTAPINPPSGNANPAFVPANVTSAAVVNYIYQPNGTRQREENAIFDLIFSGETGIDLGGGPIAYAFGGQVRQSNFNSKPLNDLNDRNKNPCPVEGDRSCLSRVGADIGPFIFLGQSTPVNLNQNIYAGFAEVNVPIGDKLELNGAIRYEDYGGSVGSTINPKGSFRFTPTDWLTLRGSAGTTFRGPQASQVSPDSVTSLAGIQAAANNFKSVDIFGNPNDLGPEKAFTYNIGVVAKTSGFTASVDFWSFNFKGPITTTPAQAIASSVANGTTNGTTPVNCASPFANLITFAGNVCTQGVTVGNDIARVRTDWVNGPRVKTQGLDFAIDYKFDIADQTTLSFGGQASYITKYDIADFVFRGVTVRKGYTARGFTNYFRDPFTVSKLRANAFANLRYADLNLRANYRFIQGVTDDRCPALPAPCNRTADGFETNFGREVRDYHQLDLAASYEINVGDHSALLRAGVENVFDRAPSAARLEIGYDPYTGNPYGRLYTFGITVNY